MSEPLVSVVIITYNQEKYIAQTIECALAQNVDFDYEIVIGEDCSTDRTREICLHYQEKYPDIISVISSPKNVGLLDNWYKSVCIAKGKYIAACAGDDYWHNPDKLKRQAKILEANQDCGMVHSDAFALNESTGNIEKHIHPKLEHHVDSSNFIEETLILNKVIAGTVMFRKKYFDDYYNIEELKENGIIVEDVPLWLEIAAISNVCYIPEKFLTYRLLPGSISRPNSIAKQIAFHQSCYKCMLHYYKKLIHKIDQPETILKVIHWHFNIWIFNLAFESKDIKLTRNCYNNIKRLSGSNFLKRRDNIRFYLTYLPFGQNLYFFLRKNPLFRSGKTANLL
jgi:glycosyltransferase involved in cell wall biosynthesis